MQKANLKYFLAANSCEGFVSQFENSYNAENGWRAYIIKGGPGTGKSSFLKKIVKAAESCSQKCILCPCSSDPNSLDGVIIPSKKTVILDGTAPHTLDPKYPAVCEEILNFGHFWKAENLENYEEIIEVTKQNKNLHRTASRYLQAVGQLMYDNYKTALACTKREKVENFANNLCKKIFKKTENHPYEWIRFIEGTTPQGIISYPETITSSYKNLIVFKDDYLASSNIFMEKVKENALQNGYEIISLKNPFLPSTITDHIIIPSLSVAFVTEKSNLKFENNSRKIHARRFTSNKMLHNSLERIKFNKKAVKHLLTSACETLQRAKAVHDKLEKYYIDIMDFNALNGFCDEFCNKLFKDKNTSV